jgi:phosphoribosylglycinamide formyltransferase 1
MGGPLAVGVLASGHGTTLDGLATAADTYRIAVVVVDRPDIGAIEVARRHGIPVAELGRPGTTPDAWASRVTEALTYHGVQLVVLAGFLSILPEGWVRRWEGRAVNLHPSLLPRFGGPGMYGLKVHAAVLAAGERESGATVHLITTAVDGGPTVAQARLAVRPGETAESLRQRIHPLEVDLLVRTVREFASGARPLPYRDVASGAGRP